MITVYKIYNVLFLFRNQLIRKPLLYGNYAEIPNFCIDIQNLLLQ